MRTPCAVLCLACFLAPSAFAQSGGDMLHACEMLERGMHVEKETVYYPSARELDQCWDFMKAVQQYATLADQDGKTFLTSCPSPEIGTTDVVHLFVKYARAHPEKLNLIAAAVAYNAMADAYPCQVK